MGEEVQKELDGLKQRNEELTLRCATLKTVQKTSAFCIFLVTVLL